jgi:hypothetical protein
VADGLRVRVLLRGRRCAKFIRIAAASRSTALDLAEELLTRAIDAERDPVLTFDEHDRLVGVAYLDEPAQAVADGR